MRKIIVLEFITLDGVMQAPGSSKEDTSEGFKYGGWSNPYNDEVFGQEMSKQMDIERKGKYDLLLGRKTYDIFASYWPTHAEYWPQVNEITKYVVSKSLSNPKWKNTVVIKNIEELKKIIESGDADLQVYGSGKLVQSLLKNDLVDEMWLKIYPITLGTGKKLFAEGTMPKAFKLTGHKVSPSGIIFANYRRDGEVKTGEIN